MTRLWSGLCELRSGPVPGCGKVRNVPGGAGNVPGVPGSMPILTQAGAGGRARRGACVHTHARAHTREILKPWNTRNIRNKGIRIQGLAAAGLRSGCSGANVSPGPAIVQGLAAGWGTIDA